MAGHLLGVWWMMLILSDREEKGLLTHTFSSRLAHPMRLSFFFCHILAVIFTLRNLYSWSMRCFLNWLALALFWDWLIIVQNEQHKQRNSLLMSVQSELIITYFCKLLEASKRNFWGLCIRLEVFLYTYFMNDLSQIYRADAINLP